MTDEDDLHALLRTATTAQRAALLAGDTTAAYKYRREVNKTQMKLAQINGRVFVPVDFKPAVPVADQVADILNRRYGNSSQHLAAAREVLEALDALGLILTGGPE